MNLITMVLAFSFSMTVTVCLLHRTDDVELTKKKLPLAKSDLAFYLN